jgi:hypothetical protein
MKILIPISIADFSFFYLRLALLFLIVLIINNKVISFAYCFIIKPISSIIYCTRYALRLYGKFDIMAKLVFLII